MEKFREIYDELLNSPDYEDELVKTVIGSFTIRSFVFDVCQRLTKGRVRCDLCGRVEYPPYTEGDVCFEACGGIFKKDQA